MKKNLFPFVLVLLTFNLSAKKVKFSVNMSGQIISSNGVHVAGDFQAAAGLGPDWDPGTALMTKEGTTTIYSIIVNIPAFKKYEYRFLNGDQTYESEFIPDESRVGFDNVDNRWLYLDSLSNDTTFVGAILFGGNAPAGKTMIRYKVDMTTLGSISSSGIHVGTNYQALAYNPQIARLYSFGNGIYEIIDYVTNNSYSFIYYNGNTLPTSETISGACATNGKRTITVTKDTVLAPVCFSSCLACVVGISENSAASGALKLYPNPAKNYLTIANSADDINTFSVKDLFGREIIPAQTFNANQIVDVSNLSTGIYFIYTQNKSGKGQTAKFAVE